MSRAYSSGRISGMLEAWMGQHITVMTSETVIQATAEYERGLRVATIPASVVDEMGALLAARRLMSQLA